jgi:hypothetical protein
MAPIFDNQPAIKADFSYGGIFSKLKITLRLSQVLGRMLWPGAIFTYEPR